MTEHATSDRLARHLRDARIFRVIVLIVAAILIGLQALSWAGDVQDDAERQALAVGVDRLRWEIVQSGGEPGVPPADEIQENPDSVTSLPPGKPINPELLKDAADAALAEVLPGEVDSAVSDAVTEYVRACVASGECVGPAGPTGTPGAAGASGAPGLPPGPDDVAAAVSALCTTELDCEATPDEIAKAVANYCSQPGEPCGKRWTEEQIFNIAKKAAGSFRVSCPPPDEILAHPHDRFYCVMQETR